MEDNISLKTKELIGLFSTLESAEIVPWQDNTDAVGFSLLKEYPDHGPFIPVKNKKGVNDSVAMVRVWYFTKEMPKDNSEKKVRLNVAIVKASRYQFKHPFYNPDDNDSPSKESIEKSKASRQPVDLEEPSRYELFLDEKKIFDLKKDQYVTPKIVVDDIYKLHLSLMTDFYFQARMILQKWIIDGTEPVCVFLKKINYQLFGKKIKAPKDFGTGTITPYPLDSLEDSSLPEEKAIFLGSSVPVSYRAGVTFIVTFSAMYLIYYFFGYDILGIIQLIKTTTNTFFLAVLTIALLLFFDRVLPYGIFLLINVLIKLRWHLMMSKISV